MDRTYLQWNLPNWITVALMAFIGLAAIQTGVAWYKGSGPNG